MAGRIQRSRNLAALVAMMTFCHSAHGRIILKNDSAEPGSMVAFYGQLQGGDAFTSIFDVPDTYPDYKVCRLLVWIGPAGFNLFSVRIAEAGLDGNEIGVEGLLWQSDLDAYQFFGSQNELNSLDLNRFNIRSQARRLRVNVRHIEGQDAPPTIASDTDGIRPGHNQVLSFVRNQGRRVRFFTEELELDVRPLRPPGDWIMRVEIVRPDQQCPGELDPIVDAGVPPEDLDAGLSPDNDDRDAGLPPAEHDSGVEPNPDAMLVDATPIRSDSMVLEPDMDRPITPEERDSTAPSVTESNRSKVDAGVMASMEQLAPSNDLELVRIHPTTGPVDRNTEIVLTGRGFIDSPPMVGQIGDERLLEMEFLSGSTLAALVPAGLEPGTYDIRLTRSVDGQIAILPAAFTVGSIDNTDAGISSSPSGGMNGFQRTAPTSSSCSTVPGQNGPITPLLLIVVLASCRIRSRGR